MPIEHDAIREGGKVPCVRMTTFEGAPEDVERAVQLTLEHVVPALRGKPGWKGALGLVSLDGRRALTLSIWESEGALADSAGSYGDVRTRAGLLGLAVTDVDRLRVVFDEK